MGELSDIQINSEIWVEIPEKQEVSSKAWHDRMGVSLGLQCIGFDKNLYERLSNETLIREYYRDCFAQDGIGVIQCNLIEIYHQTCVKTIGKTVPEGELPIYLASLAIPLPKESFVLTIYSQEGGITGVRDAVILAKLMQEEDVTIDEETGALIGWVQEPYFPEFESPCPRNLSDFEEYDSLFPDHPLSKVRKRMNELIKEITFSDELLRRINNNPTHTLH